jgi:hypothetical protein
MRRSLFFFLVLFTVGQSQAQNLFEKPVFSPLKPRQNTAKTAFDRENLRFGGNFSMFFGSITFLDISPFAAYQLNDYFLVGTGASYIYYRQKFSNNYILQDHMYGTRVFGRASPNQNLFLHVEYELLNRTYYDFLLDKETRIWWPTPLFGAGYNQMLSDRAALSTFVLFPLNAKDDRSPYYGNPVVFRVGFMFGI